MLRRLLGGLAFGAICLSAASGWAAYTGPAPLLVVNGGTGAVTLTAHGVLIGEGTSAIVAVSPSATAGIPLVSGGASADPSYTTAVVAGGGTGVATLALNGVVVGQGTSAVHVVGSSATADATLQWGAAGSDPLAIAVPSCSTASSALSYSTTTHTYGCNSITAGAAPTVATATGASPIAITGTNLLTTIISMATPAASTINLPTAVQTAGFRLCVKDGTTNFANFNATVKSPTSGTIDGVAGATGVLMNQAHQELCFISDTTNWFIE